MPMGRWVGARSVGSLSCLLRGPGWEAAPPWDEAAGGTQVAGGVLDRQRVGRRHTSAPIDTPSVCDRESANVPLRTERDRLAHGLEKGAEATGPARSGIHCSTPRAAVLWKGKSQDQFAACWRLWPHKPVFANAGLRLGGLVCLAPSRTGIGDTLVRKHRGEVGGHLS